MRGVDEITSKFLKNAAEYCSIFFECIFSQSYNEGVLPHDWKTNKIVPVHKSGATHDPCNYRPISLTPVPCKLMEHVIFSELTRFLESNNFFSRPARVPQKFLLRHSVSFLYQPATWKSRQWFNNWLRILGFCESLWQGQSFTPPSQNEQLKYRPLNTQVDPCISNVTRTICQRQWF